MVNLPLMQKIVNNYEI